MNKVIYITGNKFKLFTAKQVLEPLGIEITNQKIDCPEIQSNSIEEVAKYSSKYASEFLKCNTLKNDTGLVIPALNNFPSAYTRYVEETIGEDGILKLMENVSDRTAYFLEVYAYTEYGKEPKVFISKTEGSIAFEKSGEYGWGYDKIFIPKGQTKTFANFDDDVRGGLWSNDGLISFGEYLKSL